MTTAAAIVVSYNSAESLRRCLEQARDVFDQVVVVDNNSDDASAEIARSSGADLVELPVNVGFGSGVNAGAATLRAEVDVIVIVNPDAYITRAAFDQLVGTLRANPQVGIVGPRLQGPLGDVQASARPFPTLTRLLAKRTPLGKIAPALRRHGDSYLDRYLDITTSAATVPWLLGAVMVLDRSTFEHLGGFDEEFFLYGEDVDLCVRCWKSGLQVMLDPNAVVVHDYQQASRHRFDPRNPATRHHWRSMARLARKYPRHFFTGNFERSVVQLGG